MQVPVRTKSMFLALCCEITLRRSEMKNSSRLQILQVYDEQRMVSILVSIMLIHDTISRIVRGFPHGVHATSTFASRGERSTRGMTSE